MASDEELVSRAMSGDTESFNQLVRRWERPIYALAYRTLGREEDARDVTQDTFLRAFRSLNGFRGQAKFSSWLYRIALNLCRDWMRRERRTPVVQAPEGVDVIELASERGPTESIEELVTRRNLGAIVQRAMATLSEEQRTTIILKEYQGLTFQEIAELQGCPLSTVKTRLYQGLTVLRRELDKQGDPRPGGIGRARGDTGARIGGRAFLAPLAGAFVESECSDVSRSDSFDLRRTDMSTRDTHSTSVPDRTACPDGDALVSYLYDEFEPRSGLDRTGLSMHLRECEACAAELDALGGVREQLGAWVAPDMDLRYRLVQEPVRRAGWRSALDGLRSGWLRPVFPMAAIAILVGAALALARLDVQYDSSGLQVRTGWGHASSAGLSPASSSSSAAADPRGEAQIRAEIASLREELRRARAVMASGAGLTATSATPARVSAQTVAARPSDAALLKSLRQLIDESEVRQQQNLQLRISEIARDFTLRRQADLVQVEQGFSRLAGQRQQDAAEQQRLFNSLRNVSTQGRPPQ